MKGIKRFSRYLEKQKKHKEFTKAFEREGIYADLAIQVAKLREQEGYTQHDLAQVLHTTQQTISRLENPRNRSLSLSTLIRLASLFKKELRIEFV